MPYENQTEQLKQTNCKAFLWFRKNYLKNKIKANEKVEATWNKTKKYY